MAEWEVIELTPFEWEQDRTTVHMSHFITKCMINPLPTMTILQWRVHASTNLCPLCGILPGKIHRICQCTHKVSRGRCTASVYIFWKWLETRNMDPDISTHFINVLIYIAGEGNDLPQCLNLNPHSNILHTVWTSITLRFILKSLALTQQTHFTHIGSKKAGLKCSSQLITQIWNLIYRQWLHHSKLKHSGEVLDDRWIVIPRKWYVTPKS